MAIRELFSVLQTNYPLAATTAGTIHAGMIVARDANGYAIIGDRNVSANYYIGLSADETTRTGNTIIQADPVGSTSIAADGSFNANNNGFYSSMKRALGDYQDESVSNVSDLNSGANGYQGPRRGIGVYTTPSGQFIIDSTCYSKLTTVATAQGQETDTSAWAIGDLLTCGTASATAPSAGLFVKCATLTWGRPIARIDAIDNNTGLVWITLLPAPTTWIAA